MNILLRHPKITQAYLSDELPEQELPLKLVSLRPSSLQSFGEFWQAMGGKEGTKPKVVLHCTVTISVPLDDAVDEVGLVGVYQPSSSLYCLYYGRRYLSGYSRFTDWQSD